MPSTGKTIPPLHPPYESPHPAPGQPAVQNGKRLATPRSFHAAMNSICDIMRRSNGAGAMKYVLMEPVVLIPRTDLQGDIEQRLPPPKTSTKKP